MRRSPQLAAALLAVFPLAGCRTVTTAALPGRGLTVDGPGASYSGGRAVQTFAQPPAVVLPALLSALADLQIGSIRQTSAGGTMSIEGTTADDRMTSVVVRPHPSGTRLSARIGLFGDKALSQALMDRVGVRLGALPPSAIPADPPSSPDANPYFSRSAVSDAEMLRDQAEAPYRGTVIP